MLKLLAMVSMVADHTAVIFSGADFLTTVLLTAGGRGFTVYKILRTFGCLAFPIFCFLIAEGAAKTKNIRKYCVRLAVFAILSEIPFNLLVSQNVFCAEKQNVYFTLLLGVLMIFVYENVRREVGKFFLMALLAVTAICLKTDYGLKGVLLILVMYALRAKPALQAVLSYPLLSGGLPAMAAFIPINLYNGRRGFIRSACWKYAFYIFYPVHILLIIAIKMCIQ